MPMTISVARQRHSLQSNKYFGTIKNTPQSVALVTDRTEMAMESLYQKYKKIINLRAL